MIQPPIDDPTPQTGMNAFLLRHLPQDTTIIEEWRPVIKHERSAGRQPAEPAPASQHVSAGGADADEQLLERIVELEDLLRQDAARKPKFQKPKLQAAWRSELDELNRRLDG